MSMERRSFLQKTSLALAFMPFSRSLHAQTPFEPAPSRTNTELLDELSSRSLTRIAFGSCNDTQKDMSYWSHIARDQPDLWIWLGDNIYADFTSLAERENRYRQIKRHPLYQGFRQATPIIGTWDDHDYGYNNSNGTFWSKEESQQLFCDFMDIPADSAARTQDGVYRSFVFGPRGQRTQVILLDLRYNLDPNSVRRKILGDAQWSWFENEVLSSTADLLVIGSSLAVTSDIALLGLEGWTAYGEERLRLYDLLSRTDTPAVLLSGDRHFAELYRVRLPSGRVIHEAMSSGLTHATGVLLPHPGRISPMIDRRNYGMLEVDWSTGRPEVTMQIKSAETYGVLAEARVLI
jgi:alkaline phosphatase D